MKTITTIETASELRASASVLSDPQRAAADASPIVRVTRLRTAFGTYIGAVVPVSLDDLVGEPHDVLSDGVLELLEEARNRQSSAPAPTMSRDCATCGESTEGYAAAEVVRDGRHVLVHADTCMAAGEEIA